MGCFFNFNSIVLGEKVKEIIFISDAHEKLKKVRYQVVYHKVLVYCLGISNDKRKNIKSIYDFKTGNVKTECLYEGWQTSGSIKVVRMAINLYCNVTPSVLYYDDVDKHGFYKLCRKVTGNRMQNTMMYLAVI